MARPYSEARKILRDADISSYKDDLDKFEAGTRAENMSASSQKSYLGYLKIFCAYCVIFRNGVSLMNVDISDIQAFIAYLMEVEQLRPNTVNSYLAAIRKMFAYLRGETLDKKRLPDLFVDTYLPRVPTADEVALMLKACSGILERLFLLILISTGVRFSEALVLKFSDLLRNEHLIHVGLSKSRMERRVPLNDNVIAELTKYCNESNANHPDHKLTPDDYIFFNENRDGHLNDSYLRKLFTGIQERAGLKDKHYTPHSCRHFFALQYYLQSNDLLLVKRLLGHKSLESTETYLVLAAAIEAQERYVNPLDVVLNSENAKNKQVR